MQQARHSIIYFLGRGLPGLVNFFAISLYTRLISPEEYGKYALVTASVILFNTVLYQWLRLVLLRFLPNCKTDDAQQKLYSSLAIGFIISCLVSVLLAIIYYFVNITDATLTNLLLFGVVLLWFEAFFEISLEFFRSNLKAAAYSRAFIVKSVLAIVIGTSLAYLKMGAWGLVIGMLSADILVSLLFFRPFVSKLISNFKYFDKSYFKVLLRYGLPITLSYAMTFIINSSDRYFIKYYMGDSATGMYAVGYDMARSSIWVIMTSINLASFPIAVRAFERGGAEEANVQLKANLILLLAISVPAALGLASLADKVAYIFIGKAYTKEVTIIIPMITIGALVAGMKNFYVDQSFQLGHKTHLQIWSVIIAAIANIFFNILWIPTMGIMGAIYSTLISFVVALIVSIIFSRKSYKLPFPGLSILKISVAAIVMGAVLLFIKQYFNSSIISLTILILIGGLIYGVFLLSLGVFKWSEIVKKR